MAKSILMQVLIDCENQLGWVPKGKKLFQARAAMHSTMTHTMNNRRVSEEDLAITVAWCRARRYPINDPQELFGLVERAKERAQVKGPAAGSLDEQRNTAAAWEFATSDEQSPYWINRITRSVADGLSETLAEWSAAGRGHTHEQVA